VLLHTYSCGTPHVAKICCANGATGLSDGIPCSVTNRKNDKIHRTSVVTHVGVTKRRVRVLGRTSYSKNSRQSRVIHKWRPQFVPTIHMGRQKRAQSASAQGDLKATCKQQSWRKLVIGNWNNSQFFGDFNALETTLVYRRMRSVNMLMQTKTVTESFCDCAATVQCTS